MSRPKKNSRNISRDARVPEAAAAAIAGVSTKANRLQWKFVSWGSVILGSIGLAIWLWPNNQPRITDPAILDAKIKAIDVQVENGQLGPAGDAIKSLAADTSLKPAHCFRLGQLAIDSNVEELITPLLARASLDKSLEPKILYLKGIVALKQQHAVEAEDHWLNATKLNPQFIPGWERLAQLYMTQMRPEPLRKTLDAMQTCRPLLLDEMVVYSAAYEPYYSASQRQSVVDAYANADPTDGFSRAAGARYRLIEDQVQNAVDWINARGDRPLHTSEAAVMVDAAIRTGDLQGAWNLLNQWPLEDDSLAGRNEPLQITRARGMYLAAAGEWGPAAYFLQKVAAATPKDTAAIYQLGLAFQRIGISNAAAAALSLAGKNERLATMVFRIRHPSVTDPSKLSPLFVGTAALLAELNQPEEAAIWLQMAAPYLSGSTEYQETGRRVVALARQKTISDELRQVLTASVLRPTLWPPAPRIATSDRSVRNPGAATDPQFTELGTDSGVEFEFVVGGTGKNWLIESLGGGVAIIDYDGDGWPDLYLAQGGPLLETDTAVKPATGIHPDATGDKLFRNLGNGRFSDVTSVAGLGDRHYSQGCTAGDFDNDGDADLVVANFGECVIYENCGDGTFTDITAASGIRGSRWHTSLAFTDVDLDGDADLFIATYVGEAFKICRRANGAYSTCSPGNFPAEPDLLWLNNGNGTFRDVSEIAGISVADGKGLGVVAADFTGDGKPDIYVANDGTPNFLFRNDGVGPDGIPRFTEIGLAGGCAVSSTGNAQAGMGIACEDFDSNGWLDLYTTNFFKECHTLYLNQGDGFFEDRTATAGLMEPTRQLLGFGVQAADFLLDGTPGVMIANGHVNDFSDRNEPWKMPPQLFTSDGQGHFSDRSKSAGDYFQSEILGRAVARWDFNRDFRPDLVVTHLDRRAAILRNSSKFCGNAVFMECVGVSSNRDGRACRITAETNGQRRVFEITSGDGFMASNERGLCIGLGTAEVLDRLVVEWPSRQKTELADVAANTRWKLVETGGAFQISGSGDSP